MSFILISLQRYVYCLIFQYLLFFRVNVCTMLHIIPIPQSHSRPYLGRVGLSRDTFSFHER